MRHRFRDCTRIAAGALIFKPPLIGQTGAGPGVRPGFGFDI
jgi:hypothetical protein